MLAKQYRLIKDKDFVRLAHRGQAVFCPEMGLKWVKNDLPYSRFGVVVSLKVDKRAVARNRLKRVIRAVLRENFLMFRRGFDFMILTRAEAKGLNYTQIKGKIFRLFEKGGLIQLEK